MKRYLLALLFIVAVLLISSNAVYANSIEDFKEGVRLFKTGKYSEAVKLFRRVQTDLRGEEADQLRSKCAVMIREVNYSTIFRMLSNRHPEPNIRSDIRGFAQWLMSATKGLPGEISTSVPEIRNAITKAVRDPDPIERLRWADVTRTRFGEFAVPEIHALFLHCGNDEVMGRAVDLLVQMGAQVVMPVVELFQSSNPYDRMHAARVLGDLADRRAIPALVEHFKSDPDTTVQQECQYALEKILDMDLEGKVDALAHPKDYYYSLALQYYHQIPTLVYGRLDTFVVWRWVKFNEKDENSAGKLEYDMDIPLWAYMDICAEDLILDSLNSIINDGEINPDTDITYPRSWNLLIAVNLRQYLEAKFRFKTASAEEKQRFAKVFERAHRGLVLTGAAGQEILYKALQRTLIDRLPELSVAILDKIRTTGSKHYVPRTNLYAKDPKERLGGQLIDALQSDDKRVRYAAAATLFTLSPNDSFYLKMIARNVLIQGLGESSQRTINVITSDLGARNDLRIQLQKLGYYSYYSDTVRQGIVRALGFPSDDLILLDAKLASKVVRVRRIGRDEFRKSEVEQRETIFAVLRDDFRTADIPVVLMVRDDDDVAELRRLYQEGFDAGQIKGIVNLTTLRNDPMVAETTVFSEIWKEKIDDAKDRANQFAILCANSLLGFDVATTPHEIDIISQALIARIYQDATNSEVKVAMLKALAHFASTPTPKKIKYQIWHQDIVLNLLPVLMSDTVENRPLVKAWACKVIKEVYLNQQGSADAVGVESLWNKTLIPGKGTAEDSNPLEEPFWALYEMVAYQPESGKDLTGAAKIQWDKEIKMVRESAGEALGCAPLTNIQKVYIFDKRRINRDLFGEKKDTAEVNDDDDDEWADDDDDEWADDDDDDEMADDDDDEDWDDDDDEDDEDDEMTTNGMMTMMTMMMTTIGMTMTMMNGKTNKPNII